jgi:hypothetical protein
VPADEEVVMQVSRKSSVLIAAAALVLPHVAFTVAAGPAHAGWGGVPDGGRPPGGGAMYFDFDGSGSIEATDLICSGSYAGPGRGGEDVFLTAGHCLPPAEEGIPPQDISVSFDGDGSDGVDSPIAVSAYHQMPGFGHDLGDARDLGVLLLPAGSVAAAFPDAPAVELPTAGYLDDLKRSGDLRFRVVDLVGYGVTPVWRLPGGTGFEYDGVRKTGTSVITGLSKAWVHYNQNPRGIGTGSGVCFGDSGSPQLERGTLLVVSVTSGGNGNCNANNYNYRVDTPGARAFLGRFLVLP